MRSELAEYLDQMQHVADKKSVIVQARHIDVLEYYKYCSISPEEAFIEYEKFLVRWNAITDNGKNTKATV